MNLQKNIPLKKYSTFGVGGNADFFVEICSPADLVKACEYAEKNMLNTFFLGGGSNLLFSDKGFRGIIFYFQNQKIVSLKNKSGEMSGQFEIEAGAPLGKIFGHAKKENRDFALFSTIPGTIGGAVAGNAGIPGLEIQDMFVSATVYDQKSQKFLSVDADFFQFEYRKTTFHQPEISDQYIIWSVVLQLPELPEQNIEQKLKDFFEARKSKQPWGKTGGSFFFNPPEGAAGFFLDQSGMKGYAVGDAFFSEKHANFLMNKKNATQEEVTALARLGQQKVLEKFGIEIFPEVKILDEKGRFVGL